MKLFDSHAHLDMRRQSMEVVVDMIERAFQSDIAAILIVAGADTPGEYDTSLGLAERYDQIVAAAGIHPHAGTSATESALDALRRTLRHEKIRALGEIGLDYHYNYSPPKAQRQAFIRQMRLAHEINLPVIIHTREADEDTIAILRDEGADALGGVIHCFSGTEKLAQGALDMGFYISFSGIVTFPKAADIQAIAGEISANRIMAETDTPFLAPVPHRGKSNEPAWVKHVVEKLAELRGVSVEEMAATTHHNALSCYRMLGSALPANFVVDEKWIARKKRLHS
jgi:TatD DNase family protein